MLYHAKKGRGLINIINKPKNSFFRKIFDYFQGEKPIDLRKDYLSENSAYNYPVDELDYKSHTPMNLGQDKDMGINQY
jgi:hypothetical protein